MSTKKKQLREDFRNAVFARDQYQCVFCPAKEHLDAHHITDRSKMPNGGYVEENGITLCPAHHLTAELFHITNGEEWHQGFHPDDLYDRISSSYDKAFEASKKLKR